MSQDEVKKSRRPADSAFQQQKLAAWQPVLTPRTVLPTFFIIGLLFMPIGGLLFWSSGKVNEIMIDYSNCGDFVQPQYLDDTKYTFLFSTAFDSSSLEPPAYSYQNVSDFLDPTFHNPNNLTIKRCNLDFTVPETMQGPIFMYYRLTNFYQNHRQYIKNYDPTQLGGSVVDNATINTNCGPVAFNSNDSMQVYPCGLIANSMFNDTASDFTSLNNGNGYTFQRTGIAWPTDKKKYGQTQYATDTIIPPPNWATRYPNGLYTEQYPPPDLSSMERLMVWMHTAALPDFRKIWARNDRDTLNVGRYRVSIDLNFETKIYEGTKWIVLSTTSPLGGRNPYLGIAYMAIGGISFFLGLLFTLRHCFKPRKLGDQSFLSWNQPGGGLPLNKRGKKLLKQQ